MGVVIYWGGRWGSQRSQRARVHQGCRTTAGGVGGGGMPAGGTCCKISDEQIQGPSSGTFWEILVPGDGGQ